MIYGRNATVMSSDSSDEDTNNPLNYTNLKTVSEYMHLAPAYFSSRFSKVTGYTFVRYLTVFRLINAQ